MTEMSKVQWWWLKQGRKLHLSHVKENRGNSLELGWCDHRGHRLLFCSSKLVTSTFSSQVAIELQLPSPLLT